MKHRPKKTQIAIIGPAWGNGGTEQHAELLTSELPQRGLEIVEYLVTNRDLIDRAAQQRAARPVEYVHPDDLEEETAYADALLMWGFEADKYFEPHDTQVRIHVNHGASDWQQTNTTGSERATDVFVDVSKHVADAIQTKSPRTTITNAVDPSRLTITAPREHNRQAMGLTPKDTLIGYVGRLADEKHPETLIHAVQRLGERYHALIVGDGANAGQLHDIARHTQTGRIMFGFDHHRMGDYYEAMDWFVMPSEHEGFCLATAEAMFTGTPPIMTRTGLATHHINDRINGRIFDGSPNQLAAIVKEYANNPHGRQLMGLTAREHARTHFTPARFWNEWENLITDLIESKRGRILRG